jgi:3-hydroxyacyl-[acyl-carrier-protein] dehydratase
MNQARIDARVPATHPALPGHFPGQPIVPGVVLLALVHEQACAAIGFSPGPSQWRRVKFLGPVLPEQALVIALDGNEEGFSFAIQLSDGQPVAKGQCRHAPLA